MSSLSNTKEDITLSNYDTQNINVLNYNENEVFVDSGKEHYKFSASRDGKTPTIVPMSLNELQYIASNTDIILTGWLTFDEDIKEDIFKELRIPNWKNILSNEEIQNILVHPTMEGLQKLLDITNHTYFDRVRIIMFKLMSDGIDITTKVSRIVDQRYNELRNKQRITSIILTQKDTRKYASPDDLKELSEQNQTLQNQLDEMKKMMEQMMKAQTASDSDAEGGKNMESTTSTTTSTKKKVGRPSTKKTL